MMKKGAQCNENLLSDRKCVFHIVMEADTWKKIGGLAPKPLIRATYDSDDKRSRI